MSDHNYTWLDVDIATNSSGSALWETGASNGIRCSPKKLDHHVTAFNSCYQNCSNHDYSSTANDCKHQIASSPLATFMITVVLNMIAMVMIRSFFLKKKQPTRDLLCNHVQLATLDWLISDWYWVHLDCSMTTGTRSVFSCTACLAQDLARRWLIIACCYIN